MMHQKFFFLATLVIGLVTSSCTSTRFSEKKFQEAKRVEPYDVVIVPGVPYMDKGFGAVFAARILWAKYLMDSGITKNVIFSGAAVATPYIEGIAMKVIADSLGTDPNHTFAETRAEHSTENAYYGMKMAQKMGFKRIALASDPFQTKSLRKMLKKRCNNMPYVPVVFVRIDPTKKRELFLPSIDPKDAFVPNFVPLADREGFFERLRGTYGKHINFNE